MSSAQILRNFSLSPSSPPLEAGNSLRPTTPPAACARKQCHILLPFLRFVKRLFRQLNSGEMPDETPILRVVFESRRQQFVPYCPHHFVIHNMRCFVAQRASMKPGVLNVRSMSAYANRNLTVCFCSSEIPSVVIVLPKSIQFSHTSQSDWLITLGARLHKWPLCSTSHRLFFSLSRRDIPELRCLREGCFALPSLQPPIVPGVFRFPSMRGRSFPATPLPKACGNRPKFLLLSSAPLHAALWQSRSEPVKGVR